MKRAPFIYVLALSACCLVAGCRPNAGSAGHPGSETYLKDGISAVNPGGFNEVTDPAAGVTMLAPHGFEWYTAETFLAAANTANPAVQGGMAAESSNLIEVFDAGVSHLQRCLFPASIEVEPMPPGSIEAAVEQAKAKSGSEWFVKEPISTPMGSVPVSVRTIEKTDLLGAKVQVEQRRYLFCWKNASFAVFTYCPKDMLLELSRSLEQAALTVRPVKVDQNAQLVIPPTSEKRGRFATQGEIWQEQRLRDRDQDSLDQINEVQRQNAERRRLQEEQNARTSGDASAGGPSSGSPGGQTQDSGPKQPAGESGTTAPPGG